MKTLEETKDLIAVKHGWSGWHYNGVINKIVNEVATEYARQMCDLQIEKCAEKAKIKKKMLPFNYVLETIDKESILNTPNVVTIK